MANHQIPQGRSTLPITGFIRFASPVVQNATSMLKYVMFKSCLKNIRGSIVSCNVYERVQFNAGRFLTFATYF